MNCSCNHFICGFNGFKQIEQCKSKVQINLHGDSEYSSGSSKEEEISAAHDPYFCKTNETANYFSVPQEVNTEIKLCTWSNVWGVTGNGKLGCHGYNSLSLLTKVNDKFKDFTTGKVVSVGKDILLQDGSHTVLLEGDGRTFEVTSNIDHVALVACTRDQVYVTKDCQCFEGHVETSGEGQGCKKLNLRPILMDIQVQTISCGFEHSLILTSHGAVFSLGSSSRGQLGHGEVTVDLQKVPRCVDTFTGILVVAIATGGWHSAAVTDTGDVYVWGWNESGQLGLPNGTISSTEDTAVDTPAEHKSMTYDTEHLNRRTEDKIDVTDVHGQKRKFTDFDVGNTTGKHGIVNCTKCTKMLDTSESFYCAVCKEHLDLQHQNLIQTSTSLENRKHFSDCASDFKWNDSNCVPHKYYQSVDCVQVQTVPYGLDFPDDLHVISVSCGTRHTCILSDSGLLLTSGWNGYGQLCHGDTKSRDYFETVTYFTSRNEKITDVTAQYWNTYIVTGQK